MVGAHEFLFFQQIAMTVSLECSSTRGTSSRRCNILIHRTRRWSTLELRVSSGDKVRRENARNQLGRCEMNTKISDLDILSHWRIYTETLQRTHTNSHTWFRFTQSRFSVVHCCSYRTPLGPHWSVSIAGTRMGTFNLCAEEVCRLGADQATLSVRLVSREFLAENPSNLTGKSIFHSSPRIRKTIRTLNLI